MLPPPFWGSIHIFPRCASTIFLQMVGTALVYCAVAKPGNSVEAPQVIGALAGILLIEGLWTPVAGAVAGCAEAWVALSSPAHIWNPAAFAVLGVTR